MDALNVALLQLRPKRKGEPSRMKSGSLNSSSTFNDAKQEAIDEEEIGASEEGEEPVQGEELADDEGQR